MGKRQKVDVVFVPKDLLFEILILLSVKTLLRLRCVSKLWCSIIDDPLFVQKHHIRSHTRPGGLNLLLQLGHRNFLGSLDPEGGPTSYLLPLPDTVDLYIPFQSINGLVCINNSIYNPSTRKFKVLPPITTSVPYREEKYLLGFEPSTNKYKVLAICGFLPNLVSEDSQVELKIEFKILTLGTNLWREIDTSELQLGVPRILNTDYARAYCITDVIYIISKRDSKDVIIAFEVGCEKFQIIRFPDSANTENCLLIQVKEHLALIDRKMSAIWILEDHEKQLWSRESLVLPSRGSFIPDGTIHMGDIVFRSHPSKLFYYNVERKALRDVSCSTLSCDPRRITKHVECLYRLKDM
ncbi:putative F-box protein At1g47790 [Cornus florida]|uniref:putative F-box protein At1g47790 n=1 Tax=Cornus florida TaxID=4283 RepID=UPI00289A5DF4|nr:putative F-box protein At1g47790 [Cornus florida]